MHPSTYKVKLSSVPIISVLSYPILSNTPASNSPLYSLRLKTIINIPETLVNTNTVTNLPETGVNTNTVKNIPETGGNANIYCYELTRKWCKHQRCYKLSSIAWSSGSSSADKQEK